MLRLGRQGRGDAVRFRLSGTLTALEATFLKQEVREALAEGARDVVLDLDEVDFVDSTGLGAFVALHKSAAEVGGALRLLRPGANVRAVLELTRLHRVLRVEDGPCESDPEGVRSGPSERP